MPKRSKHIKPTDKDKPWNKQKAKRQPYSNERKVNKVFLIICEGINTEPSYFKSFPVESAQVQSYGLGTSKTKLVEYVIEAKKEDNDEDTEYWAVFDMDVVLDQIEKQKEDFNAAIELAEANNIRVAYSNDSFEVWLILHYQYFDSEWTRRECYRKLSELWNCNYEKMGKRLDFCRQIYDRLAEEENADQQQAIIWAKNLLERQKGLPHSEQRPVTTVHLLVQKLNKYV